MKEENLALKALGYLPVSILMGRSSLYTFEQCHNKALLVLKEGDH
jgi:hypothetical protein